MTVHCYCYLSLFLLMLCGCIIKENSSSTSTTFHPKLSGPELIAQLDQLAFFHLTDSSDLDEVKVAFESSYLKHNFFEGVMRGTSTDFMDNRYHWIDCEELFEVGGLSIYLTQVNQTFQRLGLVLAFGEAQHEQSETHWRRTIEINGTEYVVFDQDFSYRDWDQTYCRFLEILNTELDKQGSTERFYPILCGNGGAFVLLTPEQFTFVQQHYPNDDAHPRTLEDWKVTYGLQ